MGRNEEERAPEERDDDSLMCRGGYIPIPYTPRLVYFGEHQEDREHQEEGPKEVRLSNIAALLAPVLTIIIILIIAIYF